MPSETNKGIKNTEDSSKSERPTGANSDNSSPKQPKDSSTKPQGTETKDR